MMGKQSLIQKPSQTPLFLDAIWVDLWPLETDPPSKDLYNGVYPKPGMTRCTIARHGAGNAANAPRAFDTSQRLPGAIVIGMACNGKPRIHLDQDTDAWLRRLVVLSLKTPTHEQHFGKMAELILKNESAGILNWLLEGRSKLAKDKLQLVQTPEQKERAATLLLASDSPAAFVRSCIRKAKGGVIWGADLYEQYQKWCRNLALRPFAAKEFMKAAKEEIETEFGIRPRHDLVRDNGKAGRGWSGLAVVMEKGDAENLEHQSVLSA